MGRQKGRRERGDRERKREGEEREAKETERGVIGRRSPAADGGQAAAKPGGRLAYQHLFFFLFLQLDQDDAYPSKFQPCGVGRPLGPWTATGRRTGLQTLTPQPGTVFPGTLARFFARPGWSRWRRSLVGGHVAAYIIIVLYPTYSLWRKFNCVKIPQSEANKIRESLG